MGYESLSTVVVLAIVVILMLIWLPRRTIKGMKRVIEHREDRFSPSLHLVDADSGTRFSDETVAAAKGVLMQSTEAHKAQHPKNGSRKFAPFVTPRSAGGAPSPSHC